MENKELAKNLMCVCMRNKVEIWVEKEKIEKLKEILANTTGNRFIDFDGQSINTADVIGIFDAQTMEEMTRRKNGQWKCDQGNWHNRYENCQCPPKEIIELKEKIKEAYSNCKECDNGWIYPADKNLPVRICSCCVEFYKKLQEAKQRLNYKD
jgi:hypothetical protein